jgi:thermitase
MRVVLAYLFIFISSYSYGKDNQFSIEHVSQLKNWGLINFEDLSDINAPEAWEIEKGNKNIVVAVIDSGIDPFDGNLSPNLWHSPENPLIFGWDFTQNHPNPLDHHGHGTHVSGIIAAKMDSIRGISGVAPNVTIMPVKYWSESNTGLQNLELSIKAIDYAIDNGANIINFSGGGPDFNEKEYLAYKRAESKNILIVSAAGNESQNIDNEDNFYYPASYRLSNMISVMATDIHNKPVESSNYGKNNVDVSAPGEQIFSILPGNRSGYMTGTSQATAFVSGIAALLLSHNKTLTPKEIKAIIIKSSDRFDQLKDKNVSGGRVNAYSALVLVEKKMLAKNSKKCHYKKTNANKH